MEQIEENKEIQEKKPFWKETTFIYWVSPICVSVGAIFLDSGYLNYFDIPIMYAEINLFTPIGILINILILVTLIFVAIAVAIPLSKSKNLLFKVLVRPWMLFFITFMTLICLISDQNFTYLWLWYCAYVASLIIGVLIRRKKNMSWTERLDFEINEWFGAPSNNPKKNSRLFNFGLSLFSIFLMLISIHGFSSYIAGNVIDIWVLANNDSVIAIKRNNEIYLLKTYDKKTRILSKDFKIIKIDSEGLVLTKMNPRVKLITAEKAVYEAKLKKEEDASELSYKYALDEIFTIFKDFISKLKNTLNLFINNITQIQQI